MNILSANALFATVSELVIAIVSRKVVHRFPDAILIALLHFIKPHSISCVRIAVRHLELFKMMGKTITHGNCKNGVKVLSPWEAQIVV